MVSKHSEKTESIKEISPEQGLWKKFWEIEKGSHFQDERCTIDRKLWAMKHLCTQSSYRTTSYWKHKRNSEQTLAWSHTWKTAAWGFRLRLRSHTCVHSTCLGTQLLCARYPYAPETPILSLIPPDIYENSISALGVKPAVGCGMRGQQHLS